MNYTQGSRAPGTLLMPGAPGAPGIPGIGGTTASSEQMIILWYYNLF